MSKKQYLAIGLMVTNLIAASTLYSAANLTPAFAHEDAIHQQILADVTSKNKDGHTWLEMTIGNYSESAISFGSLKIDDEELAMINTILQAGESLTLKGEAAIMVPDIYMSSMFLSLKLDTGTEDPMMIPVVVTN